MFHVRWLINLKLLIIISLDGIHCSIDGHYKPRRNTTKFGTDPCNPLYWYPRPIPEYCNYKDVTTKAPNMPMIPMPIPVHLPPLLPSIIGYSLPFGVPLAPTNPMLPVAAPPFPSLSMFAERPPPPVPPPPIMSPFASYVPPYGIQRSMLGMVPGLPGLVSPDGGINIMPFSDAYADLLEKHKEKMIRRRLKKLLDEYDRYPWKGYYKNSRRVGTRRINEPQEMSRQPDEMLRDSPEDNVSGPQAIYRAAPENNVRGPRVTLKDLQEDNIRGSQEMLRGPHDMLRDLPEDNVRESQEIFRDLPAGNVREPQHMFKTSPEYHEIAQKRDPGITKMTSLEEIFKKYDFLKNDKSFPFQY